MWLWKQSQETLKPLTFWRDLRRWWRAHSLPERHRFVLNCTCTLPVPVLDPRYYLLSLFFLLWLQRRRKAAGYYSQLKNPHIHEKTVIKSPLWLWIFRQTLSHLFSIPCKSSFPSPTSFTAALQTLWIPDPMLSSAGPGRFSSKKIIFWFLSTHFHESHCLAWFLTYNF